MIFFEIIKIIALLCSITGALMITSRKGKTRLFAFLILIVANTMWLINAITISDYTQAALWVFYIFTCILGIAVILKDKKQ